VGAFDSKGRLRIIDRVKNIMKLAQGEYVALEKIENLYSSSSLIEQIFVHGDSLQDYIVAVIVPQPAQLAQIASHITGQKVSPEDRESLARATQHDKIRAKFMQEISKEGHKAGLKGFEMVKRIHLTVDPFSVEDNTLTPTFKIRRKDAYKKHQVAIDALYALGPVSSSVTKL